MIPTIQALLEDKLVTVKPVMYTDKTAALRLCTLDAGAWRTRHDFEGWKVNHLEGVYMKAEVLRGS